MHDHDNPYEASGCAEMPAPGLEPARTARAAGSIGSVGGIGEVAADAAWRGNEHAPEQSPCPYAAGSIVGTAGSRALRGRGARSNHGSRHERLHREVVDDGWGGLEGLAAEGRATEVSEEQARSIITRNNAPDVGFDHSLNPYRGCEHGCIYCYARPGHANLGLSPGLDFESRIIAKVNAPELFDAFLRKRGWQGAPIAVGTYTDCYQPAERRYRLTRRILEVAERRGQPLMIITKSRLVLRDLDILQRMARQRLVRVAISITTLDAKLARLLEPRATTPARRLDAMGRLADAGIPVSLMLAPVIPALNDHELERIMLRARHAGAQDAGMVMLRLPLEIADLFAEWLQAHFPDRAQRVLSLLYELHGGQLYDGRYHHRMRGAGPYAWMIWRRFQLMRRKLGLGEQVAPLNSEAFRRLAQRGEQLVLPGLEHEDRRE